MIVASVYLGAGLNEPSNHVAKIPPELDIMNVDAITVARRVCGDALFEFHVVLTGANVYAPGTERKREPYWTRVELDPSAKC